MDERVAVTELVTDRSIDVVVMTGVDNGDAPIVVAVAVEDLTMVEVD